MCTLRVYWNIEEHDEQRMIQLGWSSLRQLEVGLLSKAVSERIRPLYGGRSTDSAVSESWGKWVCYMMIVSYLCDVLERKVVSGMEHGVAVSTQCIKGLKSMEGTQNLQCGNNRALLEMQKVRK